MMAHLTARGPRVYFDWNATAPLRPEARAAMLAAMECVGNPSSVHAEGRAARTIVEQARHDVAALVNADPADVVFTSGATEANAIVLAGAPWRDIAVLPVEHPSLLAPLMGRVDWAAQRHLLPIDCAGRVDLGALGRAGFVSAPDKSDRLLCSVQLANGETGVVQDVAAVVGVIRQHAAKAVVHTDAVQAVGKIAVDMATLGVDALTLSAHKFGGPKGIGALIGRPSAKLSALMTGGGQERGRRGGTENIIGIAGFAAAARAARVDLNQMADVARRRDALEQAVLQLTPEAVVISGQLNQLSGSRLPNTSMIALPGFRAETLVIRLDLAGIAVSAGSACASGKVGPNPVLSAMGLGPRIAESAVRLSLGPTTTDNDIAAFLAAWKSIAASASRRAA